MGKDRYRSFRLEVESSARERQVVAIHQAISEYILKFWLLAVMGYGEE